MGNSLGSCRLLVLVWKEHLTVGPMISFLILVLLMTGLRPLWASVSPGKVESLDLAAIHKNPGRS